MAAQTPGAPTGARQPTTTGQNPTTAQKQPGTPQAMQPGTQSPRGIQPRTDPARGSPLARYAEMRSPFGLLGRFMDEMDRIFETSALGFAPTAMGGNLWNPQIEVFQRGQEMVVRADLPGMTDDNVSVQIEDDVLVISGERHDDRKEEREGYFHTERSYGSFQRSIALPQGVDPDTVKASFENGVLEISVPTPQQKSAAKKIDIGKKAPNVNTTTREDKKTGPS